MFLTLNEYGNPAFRSAGSDASPEASPQSSPTRAFQKAAAKAVGKFQGAPQAATKDRGSFLFCIPIQVGPATPYARSVKSWMQIILLVQTAVCVVRLFVQRELVGFFWTALATGLGWYAYREDLNITYVCCWGLACALNCLFDVASLAITLLFNLRSFSTFDILLRVLAPMAKLLGALFAWHLYRDHYSSGDSNMQDPLGKLVNSTGPMGYQSITKAAGSQEVRRDLMSPFKRAGAAASRLASQPQAPAGETAGWQQHSDALHQQLEAQSQSPFLTQD